MKSRDTFVHRKAEAILRSLGYQPMRSFVPAKADRVQDEWYEVWATPPGKTTKTLIVHFYGGNNGCHFYPSDANGTWAETEASLRAFAGLPLVVPVMEGGS